MPLWRRRRQSLGHQTLSSRVRAVRHDEEYRQRLDEILRDLVLPKVNDFPSAPIFAMAVSAVSVLTGSFGIGVSGGIAAARLADRQKHPRCDKIPVELLKDRAYGILAREAFEQKVSTWLLEEYFEEIVPPLLADPELQSWSFQVLDGRISSRRLSRLISLVLDPLTEKDLPIVSEFAYTQLPGHSNAEQSQQIMTLLAHSNTHVKKLTLDLLHERMPDELLLQHWEKTLSLLRDEAFLVRTAAIAEKRGY